MSLLAIAISIVIIGVEIKVAEELRHVSSEGVQIATVLLGGSSQAFGTTYEARDLGHLQEFVLIRGGDILQYLGYEFGSHTLLYGLQNAETICDGRFAHIYDVALVYHPRRFQLRPLHAHLPFLAGRCSYGARLEDACRPQPFVYTCFVLHLLL